MPTKSAIDYLKSISLFKTFNESLISTLAKHTTIRSLEVNEVLLEQGDQNINLFIMIIGKVSVQVDGSNVATLDQLGDIIGEMSVVTGSPASATIVAETPVKVLEIDIHSLNSFLGVHLVDFNMQLYKGFATILSDKLRSTNQKAKYFEDFSEMHLGEIYQGQELALQRLKEVATKHLSKLRSVIDDKDWASDQKLKSKALGEVDRIESSLQPFINRVSEDALRKHKAVLLVESNKREQSIAKMALGGTGISLDISGALDDAREKIASGNYDIVFVNSEMLSLIGEFEGKIKTKFVLMTSEAIGQYIPQLQNLKSLPNIVSRDPEDRYFTSKNIVTTVSKLAGDDVFGLGKYLAWGVDIQKNNVTGSKMRRGLNEKMVNYFKGLGVRSSRLDSVAIVAEELLMNAIYDAPVDEKGNSIYNHLDRKMDIELSPDQYSVLSYGTDGIFIGLSVADPFGVLSGRLVLDYLESCYEGNAGKLNKNKGGAGRGLHMIVELSDLVVFNIDPNNRTEVISLFHIDSRAAEARAASFHYFCEDTH